jgi:ATP-dependent Clp protease adaptor protein ClpS
MHFLNTLEKTLLIVNYVSGHDATMDSMTTKQENIALLERSKTKPPKMYKVILLNDDYTTMEFVIEVLQTFFSMSLERAAQIMLKVHNEGSAVCGLYPKDIAETKVNQIEAYATQHGHPLKCHMEEN